MRSSGLTRIGELFSLKIRRQTSEQNLIHKSISDAADIDIETLGIRSNNSRAGERVHRQFAGKKASRPIGFPERAGSKSRAGWRHEK
jgi:hypothetical protein